MVTIKNILPSKKFFLVMIGIGIGVVLVLVLSQWIGNRNERAARRQAQLAEERLARLESGGISEEEANRILEIQAQDTDGDRLKDWEEGLWGTNPLSTDTNNNGVSDFDEVQNRKNTLQKQNPIEVTAAEIEELTPLDIFTRDFYATASLIEQRNIDDSDELIKEVFFQNIASIPLYTPITLADIIIVDETPTTLLAYAKNLKSLTDQYPFDQDELGELLDIAANNIERVDATQLPVRTKYQNLATGLVKMQVPEGLQGAHVGMVNAALHLGSVVNNMLNMDADPLNSFAASLNFTDAVNTFSNTYTAVYQYLENKARS